MKQLILFRHGKSDWDVEGLSDHQRPLKKRGAAAAMTMGRALALVGQIPQLALTSSAVRARTTLELAHEAGDWGCPIKVVDSLYGVTAVEVLRLIHSTDDSLDRLLLTGHEPTWSELTEALVGGECNLRFPTACMACIEFELDSWSEIDFADGTLSWLLPSRLFADGGFDFI